MKKHSLLSSRVFWLVGSLVALAILYILLSPVIKDERPMAPGMTGTVRLTGERTLIPTDLEQSRETAGVAAMQTYRAFFYGKNKVTPPPTGPPPTNTPAPFRTGIFQVSFAPYCDPHACHISAVWAEVVNGERTRIYIGGFGDTRAATPAVIKGTVLVIVDSKDLSNSSWVEYEAPGARGVLQIVFTDGYRLTLIDELGEKYYFDVLTRQFVDGLTVTVTAPTITPLPPISPTVPSPTATWSTEYPPPVTYPPQIYPPLGTPVRIP